MIVIFIIGDGELFEIVLKFFRRLKKKIYFSDYLLYFNYVLLGLGDFNYINFCNVGKILDKRFEELGVKRFYLLGWVDDVVGLE